MFVSSSVYVVLHLLPGNIVALVPEKSQYPELLSSQNSYTYIINSDIILILPFHQNVDDHI